MAGSSQHCLFPFQQPFTFGKSFMGVGSEETFCLIGKHYCFPHEKYTETSSEIIPVGQKKA